MPGEKRDGVFISYSHPDLHVREELKKELDAWGLEKHVLDDTEIRKSEKWDPRIQEMMAAASVAVVILSDIYFRQRSAGEDYLLTKELPALLEYYDAKELDLLLLFWKPSPHFNLEKRDQVEPFTYKWKGETRDYDLHAIHGYSGTGGARLAKADEHDRLDVLQELAHEAKRRLEERREAAPEHTVAPNSHSLTVDLAIDDGSIQRSFSVTGQTIRSAPPDVPRGLLDHLRDAAGLTQPGGQQANRLGHELYELLFGDPDVDGFSHLAEQAWGQPAGCQANTMSVQIELHCERMQNPWPLSLPWNLIAFRGENLAKHCGWSVELVPAGVDTRMAARLSPEPPFLLLTDNSAEAAQQHSARMNDCLERVFGYATETQIRHSVEEIAECLRQSPQPEVLYVYATTDLDLEQLAETLGDAVPLIVLNLIGDQLRIPPPRLAQNRKIVQCLHGLADAAQSAGYKWLQTFLESSESGYQQIAMRTFGPNVRLWSGCGDLQASLAKVSKAVFRRSLIKLLLDRVKARREVSDEVATALLEDRNVLALVAAGTNADHPELLPKQVWHHYLHVRSTGTPEIVTRRPLSTGPYPDMTELCYQFAASMNSTVATWEDALDQELGDIQRDERTVLSLEWQLPGCPENEAPETWRSKWLDAWFGFAIESLVHYEKPGLLITTMLIVVTEHAEEADTWCREAQSEYRKRRRSAQHGQQFLYHDLGALSRVPPEDVERFLDVHYNLQQYHPALDPYEVAEWVHQKTDGVFSDTVKLVDELHDTGFQSIYAEQGTAHQQPQT